MLRAVHRKEAQSSRAQRMRAYARMSRLAKPALALEGAVLAGLAAVVVTDEIVARSYEERASVATHKPVEHVRFLEHMLLDEYVANDRGNAVETAVRGFQELWPAKMPTVVPRVTNEDSQTFKGTKGIGDVGAALETMGRSSERPTWPGDPPYLVVVGPSGDVKHAVAWLVTESDCFYSNTGAGASERVFRNAICSGLLHSGMMAPIAASSCAFSISISM